MPCVPLDTKGGAIFPAVQGGRLLFRLFRKRPFDSRRYFEFCPFLFYSHKLGRVKNKNEPVIPKAEPVQARPGAFVFLPVPFL
jgi:hypothetical protein